MPSICSAPACLPGWSWPDSWLTLRDLAEIQFHAGQLDEGNRTLDRLLARPTVRPEDHVHVIALSGRRDLLEQALATAEARFAEGKLVKHFALFLAYYYLDDWDQAFVWLDRAIDNREWWLFPELRSAVYLEDLRADPRFAAAMARLEAIEAIGSPTPSVATR